MTLLLELLDASAIVDLLIRSDRGESVRSALAGRDAAELFTVAHLDAEVFSALARSHREVLGEGVERTARPTLTLTDGRRPARPVRAS